MNSKPKLLDLFCGAGGAAVGYHRAGFDVTGVDIKAQPRYPFPFIQDDALEYCRVYSHEYDAIHASPPCQAYSILRFLAPRTRHADLIPATRTALIASGRPYVIENVPGAPLFNAVILCGSAFGLHSHRGYLQRHRLFESNVALMTPPCQHEGCAIGVYGGGESRRHVNRRSQTAPKAEAIVLMGIDWMSRRELSQAIPPAYTEFIGTQILAFLAR